MGERTRTRIDSGWMFHRGDVLGADAREFDDSGWTSVDLPHDYSIEGPFDQSNDMWVGYLPKEIGWYRKSLALEVAPGDRRFSLEFEGVYRNSTVWVNGSEVGSHKYGYTGFVYDITPYLLFDGQPNVISVKIDNPDTPGNNRGKEGWWYEGNGIYRHVWLTSTDALHVAPWGTLVTTPEVSAERAVVRVRTDVRNDSETELVFVLSTTIREPGGGIVGLCHCQCTLAPGMAKTVEHSTTVDRPVLWSPDSPSLYSARTAVIKAGQGVDTCVSAFGVRWFEFTSEKGFFLNGKHLQLRGMCNHADCGGLGTALPDRVNEKTVELMKQMGCNLLRSAHHDASPSLMEACDRLGMLVWAETRYLDEPDVAAPPLRDLIRRNRNHPSIICWSLANTAGSPDGKQAEYLKALNAVAKEEDSSRPTAFGCEANTDANANGFAFVTDIMGYNGGGMGIDDRDHELYPDRKMLISEFSSGRGARGLYEHMLSDVHTTYTLGDGRVLEFDGQYGSTYDLCRQFELEWTHIAERPWLAGGAMWSGFEYYGETSGWPTVTSQFGVFDICKFPKDTYYYFLQEWTDEPMVHIFPHWNWRGREGELIDVWCYSNCDSVELFLNGESLGEQPTRPLTHVEWKVPYAPGVLMARGVKDGRVACSHEIRTSGEPAGLSLTADRSSLKADGQDVSFVTVSVVDSEGSPVPTAANSVSVEVTGCGRLIGLSAGDPRGHESVKGSTMRAFGGLLLAIVQSDGEAGEIVVSVSSEGLVGATERLQAG